MASDSRRKDAATAAVGYGGVSTAAVLRHHALEQAYEGRKRTGFPLFQERRLLRTKKGRAPYIAGLVLGGTSTPAAVVGTAGLLTPREKAAKRDSDRSFVEEGLSGAHGALQQRKESVTRKVPLQLVAGNYLAGLGVGAGAGGLTNLALRHGPIKGGTRAALAASAGTAAGAASLPVQSALTRRASRDKYEVTPTGVRRRKAGRVPASRMASVHEGRRRMGADQHRFRQETVPGGIQKRQGQDALVYPGSDLSRKAKRTIVGSVTGPPIIGDVAQAVTAGRMAPRGLRAETAGRTAGGGQAGGVAGQVAGAYGAVHLANKSPRFNAKAHEASDLIDRAGGAARRFFGMKPKPERGFMDRAEARLPKAGKKLVGPLMRNKKVALIGALAGGAIGGQIGVQAGYGSALNKEREFRQRKLAERRGQTATHGSRVVGKLDSGQRPLSERQRKALARRKEISAGLSYGSGTAGLSALAIMAASKHPKLAHLERHRLPLLTTGAGISGVNAFLGANVQRKEANQQRSVARSHRPDPVTASKALGLPRVATGLRRAPAMRKGTIRQTRYPSGLTRVSTVRGGLA